MTKDLNDCTDAREWAKEFVRIRSLCKFKSDETVESMECWFASALLAGRKLGMDETNEIWLNRNNK